MATKPLTTEAIALTEKKMDMTLDDIIKMSKTAPKAKRQRIPNKRQKPPNNTVQDKKAKVRQFMVSRSSLRQGVLAQRRSNFRSNQFPLATNIARKAMVLPVHPKDFTQNRMSNWNTPRFGAPPVQNKARNGGFPVKKQQQRQHKRQGLPWLKQKGNAVQKQMPQTLDSLFSNMKEQRLRSQHNSSVHFGGTNQQLRGRGSF